MPTVHDEGPGTVPVEAQVVPFFDYECPRCGLVLKNELVRRYDDPVPCPDTTCCAAMDRRVSAPPRHLDHTVDDGFGVRNPPDSFRPKQIGYGGKPKANWRNKKDD